MELGGTLAAILIFHLAFSLGQANVIGTCTLPRTTLETLFPVNPGVETNTSIPDIPPACEENLKAVLTAIDDLSKSERIVVPDEHEDNKILEHRFKEMNAAFESLKEISDPQTTSYLDKIQFELQKMKEKKKNNPETEILRVIFNDGAKEAAQIAESATNSQEFVHRVIAQGFDSKNTTFLKYLIEFSKGFSSCDLSIVSYEQIFKRMDASGLLKDTPEMLQLWYSAKSDSDDETFKEEQEELKQRYSALLQSLSEHKIGMVKTMTGDLGAGNFSKFEQFQGFERDVLNHFLPEIIHAYYESGDLAKVKNVLDLVRKLPDFTNDCVAMEKLFQEMKSRDQEKTFEAFALWLRASYDLAKTEILEKIDETAELQMCRHVHQALSKYREKHIADYVQLVREKNWTSIVELHTSYHASLRQIVPLALDHLFDKGSNDEVAEITTWADNLPYYEENCLVLHPLFKKMIAVSNFDSFESLQAFAILRTALTKPINAEVINVCRGAKEMSPEWIFDVFWGNTSFCSITNRRNKELLTVLETRDVTTTSGRSYKWEINTDDKGFLIIEDKVKPETYLTPREQDVFISNMTEDYFQQVMTEDAATLSVWRADHLGDDFFTLYFVDDNGKKYLSVESDSCSGAKKCLKFDAKGDDHSAQWRVDCH